MGKKWGRAEVCVYLDGSLVGSTHMKTPSLSDVRIMCLSFHHLSVYLCIFIYRMFVSDLYNI